MMLLGGIFVLPAPMPPIWQGVARTLPLTYAVKGAAGRVGRPRLPMAVPDLGVLATFVALFWPAVHMMARQADA